MSTDADVEAGTDAGTAAGPTPAQRRRRLRAPLAVAALVLLTGIALALAATPAQQGALRADAPGPDGSLALVTLLREQGARVDPLDDVTAADAGLGTTVLVAAPARMSSAQRAALAASAADLVLLAPDAETLRVLAPGVRTDRAAVPEPTDPGCPLRAAVAAGPVDLTSDAYTAPPGTTACYPVAGTGAASMVAVPGAARTVTVVGDPTPFTNAELGERGNAALALQLLGAHPRVLWYLPVPPPAAPGQERSLGELLPAAVVWGAAQLLVAGVAVCLWRSRRLGGLVTERLPVVVPAGETVRGRARLYRRTGARGRAAGVLRDRARRDLAARLGRPPGVAPAEIAADVATRTGRRAEHVQDLLAGADPADDGALVELAVELDRVVDDVARA